MTAKEAPVPTQQLRCMRCGRITVLLGKHYVLENSNGETYKTPMELCEGPFQLEDVDEVITPSVSPKEIRKLPCEKCGSPSSQFLWESWGSYLDKDLVCQNCKHVVDVWDC